MARGSPSDRFNVTNSRNKPGQQQSFSPLGDYQLPDYKSAITMDRKNEKYI